MKKIIFNFIIFILALIIILLAILATKGIETNKFNKLISDKASQTKNIILKLETIKFKIDPKELSLFLETENPKISYRNIVIPAKNIKVYIDFKSLLISEPKIKKTNIILEELDITQLNKLSLIIKPSNFRSIINNKIKKGKVVSEIDIYLKDDGSIKDFIAKGSVKNLKVNLFEGLNLTKTKLSFFADKNDILIKNIFGILEDFQISDGDIKLNLENGVKLNSNFNSKINLNKNLLSKYIKFFNKNDLAKSINTFKADLNNNIYIELDKTYKIKKYNYDVSGIINDSNLIFSHPFKTPLTPKKIKEVYFSNFKIKTNFSPKKIKFTGDGKYSFNNLDFFKINLDNEIKKNLLSLKVDFDYGNTILFDLINYKKSNKSIANVFLDLEKNKDKLKIKNLNIVDEKKLIKISGLKIENDKFLSFKKITVATGNNDFVISNNRIILIKGKKFDATNLPKFLNDRNKENLLIKINSNIEIDFKNILAPMSENLQNFKLIGEIKNGKFVKISSKGDFGGGNFLDISMKKDKNSEKKYLEIYSDLTRPLLTEYSFFKGLTGGKLLFTSIIHGSKSNSKLKIEKFKVINAPGLVKLLSLADLGGLADLAEGEGLSFDVLEIDMEKNENFLKLSEILALGPSISVLMEGYKDENGITSIRGTLVPAKTLNKMIAKIPLIGNIIIPKEVGEGLFGISFKMKGPTGKIKTSINPIRTLTPRFIQKIIDKNKETK